MKRKLLYLLGFLFVTTTLLSITEQTYSECADVEVPFLPEAYCPEPPQPAEGGPSQPEVQSFTPADVSNMVNLFTGDFSYNIPLLDVGGYPINIAYTQGVGMEEDASCVGLGWNLSVGSINRIVRGLPDDFSGDEMVYEQYQKPNATLGVSADVAGMETFGILGANLSAAYRFNNYTGVNTDAALGLSASYPKRGAGSSISGKLSGTLGLNSDNGPYCNANISFAYGSEQQKLKGNFGYSASSYEGFESLAFGLDYSREMQDNSSQNRLSYSSLEASISGSHSFNSITSMAPRRNCAMTNTGFSYKSHIGGEIQGVTLQFGISGFYMEQRITMNKKITPAYGYLFSHKAVEGDVLLDFQRDEETSVDDKVPNLPATAFTYDLFQVSGQGIGAQFRAYRNDVGILHDPEISSGPNPDINVGMEFEVGSVLGFGGDVGLALGSSESGKWIENNEMLKRAAFKDTTSEYPGYRPFYFKEVGESTLFENDIYKDTEGSKAVRFETSLGTLVHKLNYGLNQFRSIEQPLVNQKTPRRNTLFSYLNAGDAALAALNPRIADFPLATREQPFQTPNHDTRTSLHRSKHHISEITVTKDDGIRYVYGIPAYNIDKKEISFNISGEVNDRTLLSENLVQYNGTYFSHTHNTNGLNQAYSTTKTPPYAYAYLLTDVLSTDYVDKTGDGPTPDDNGTYTKFNYHKASGSYRWRMPYWNKSAHYQANTNNLHERTDGDDMASFMYGEKEVWYNQSVETKNYVALFYYSTRDDARGVSDIDGGIDRTHPDQQLLKLDSISLFTRVSPGKPIQTIHFVYDYSLCKGTPTNTYNYDNDGNRITEIIPTDTKKGKLTLKEIYFTYQDSRKGTRVRYKFSYQNNQNYTDLRNDRWGNYKEDKGDFAGLSNKDFPYVQQIRRSSVDRETAAWCLSQIITPSNSTIEVQYESDDYAYVQDKPAMQMVKIIGFGEPRDLPLSGPSLNTITLSTNSGKPTWGSPNPSGFSGNHGAKDIMYFKLPKRDAPHLDCKSMLEFMTADIKEIFFSMNTKIDSLHEDVTGFMIHDHHGLALLDRDTIGWIRIPEPAGEDEMRDFHPVSLAAFRYALENLPRIAKGVSEPMPENTEQLGRELGDRIGNMFEMLAYSTLNDFMMAQNIGNLIDTNQSYIRLNNPYRNKYGGGARVRKITVADNWIEMSGSPSKTYGVEYTYTMSENGLTISSGVASYEPEIGNDENPLYLPVRVGDYDDPKYRRIVTPIGRSLFPAANVGYAKVTVQSLQDSTIERTATGKTEHEFYTARDFPVYVSSTTPQMISNMDSPEEQVANAFASFLYSEDRLTVSQGHAIQLNDMHGKQKSISVYAQGNSIPLSGISYRYKTDVNNPKLLDNHVDIIIPDGTVKSGLVSMECDFIVDTRYEKVETWLPSVNLNVNVILAGPYPVAVPMGFPWLRYECRQVHVVSATKVIHQTGIIDSIIAFDSGAKVTTKNIAYDSETGQPLVTQTANEFNDKYYSLQVPAHWVEPGMGHASINTGNEHKIASYTGNNGFASIYGAGGIRTRDHFFKGDEVCITSTALGVRLWVDSVEDNRIRLIDHNGSFYIPPPPNSLAGQYLKIIRSGKRNMQSISVGEITLQENPIIPGSAPGIRQLTRRWNKVVNASAIKYSDHWQTYNIQRVRLPDDPCVCKENKNGIMAIHQILGWITSAEGPRNFNFSNLTLPAGIVSDADKQRYFGSGPLVISSGTYGNCAEISLNASCVLTLCARDGQPLHEQITSISAITATSDTENPGCSDHSSFSAAIGFSQPITHVTSDNRSGQIIGRSPCIPLIVCQANPTVYSNSVCNMVTGIPVNPYVEGIRGQYRPLATYMYNLGLRSSPTFTTPLALSASGFYESFHPYWICEAFGGDTIAQPDLWKTLSTVTKIDPNGRALETKDAIGVYSADLYGFNKNLVVASAQNAGYHQIAFESFEDAGYPVGIAPGGCAMLRHWTLFQPSDVPATSPGIVESSISHSGKNSLRLFPGGSQSVHIPLGSIENREMRGFAYLLQPADLAGYFKPTAGEYFISVWVKLDIDPYTDNIYDVFNSAHVRVNDVLLPNRTHIIDGWQQIWGTVLIREGQTQLPIELIAGTAFTNFDDIRIQPANSSMKTYVYRPDNLRLCAELDENNFATYYEYDDEGALTRTKKETELGVMTVQEVRFAHAKSR